MRNNEVAHMHVGDHISIRGGADRNVQYLRKHITLCLNPTEMLGLQALKKRRVGINLVPRLFVLPR
jgi:hypothetical protein